MGELMEPGDVLLFILFLCKDDFETEDEDNGGKSAVLDGPDFNLVTTVFFGGVFFSKEDVEMTVAVAPGKTPGGNGNGEGGDDESEPKFGSSSDSSSEYSSKITSVSWGGLFFERLVITTFFSTFGVWTAGVT